VKRIFEEFLGGAGFHLIAEGLTRDGILCPSAADRARNRHRTGTAWAKTAVRVIITNPRYTGHQVWNKQRTDEVLLDVEDVALGHRPVMRHNDRTKWITSINVVHEALVSVEDFERAQQILAGRGRRRPGTPNETGRIYLLKGMIHCDPCGRSMQAQYIRQVAYYRCRYPREYAAAHKIAHPANVYLREDVLIDPLDSWLATAFNTGNKTRTVESMFEAQKHSIDEDPQIAQLRSQMAACDARIARYQATLDAGGDPTVIAGWTSKVQAERLALQAQLRGLDGRVPQRMSRSEIAELVDQLGNIAKALRRADPQDKAEIYRALGLRLSFDPAEQKVRAETRLGPDRRLMGGVGEGT
jgi:site-specific DNA recombinase